MHRVLKKTPKIRSASRSTGIKARPAASEVTTSVPDVAAPSAAVVPPSAAVVPSAQLVSPGARLVDIGSEWLQMAPSFELVAQALDTLHFPMQERRYNCKTDPDQAGQ